MNEREKIKTLIDEISIIASRNSSFVYCFEYFTTEAEKILSKSKKWAKTKISSGVSSIDIFKGYEEAVIKDIKDGVYKKYADPCGDINIRIVLSEYYNTFLSHCTYSEKDFCLTEGATGAIALFFEWFSSVFSKKEVLIVGPSYYLFKLQCKKFKIKYKEIITPVKEKGRTSFYNYSYIEKQFNAKTKLIILTNPGNPTGDSLSKHQIQKIIHLAKSKNALVLVDSLFLDIPITTGKIILKNNFVKYGFEQDYLTNIFIVQGWSKNINIPGFRIGYVVSKNNEAINYIVSAQERSSFFAPPSNYKSLIVLDTYIRARYICFGLSSLEVIKKRENIIKNSILSFFSNEYDAVFFDFIKYQESVIDLYKKNRKAGISLIGKRVKSMTNDTFGFNTFIKISIPFHVNLFDFSINLFIQTGVKLQTGPYFGYNQKYWEQLDGLWFRFTYASKIEDIENGIIRLCKFIDNLDNNSKNYYNTNLILN